MKYLRKTLQWVVFIIVLLLGGCWLYIWNITPDHSGKVHLGGLIEKAEVHFDEYGIPHIKAQNKEDLYRVFGYVHAQDRLFQMEMLRRVGSGTLAEVLGKDMLEADLLFRTLGIPQNARENADRILAADSDKEYMKLIQAYLDGVNRFVETGPNPIEFSLMGIPKKKFDVYDMYCIAGYMAYSFNLGSRTDPLITTIHEKYGSRYLEELGVFEVDSLKTVPVHYPGLGKYSLISSSINDVMESLPVVPFLGSNSWALSGEKTESGEVMLCNDTHIGYSQPAVWYEAHLHCPEFDFYGNFLGGIPYALVGHNKRTAWGLTILEQDDWDFYREKTNSEDATQYLTDKGPQSYSTTVDTIRIKNAKDTIIVIKATNHGPIINAAIESLEPDDPISVRWDYLKFDNDLLKIFHGINNCQSLNEMEFWVSKIHGPGLNIVYGDSEGNIAWWAAAKLAIRPDHVNSKLILNGFSGEDDIQGYHPFSYNPQAINPPWGFVYSANDQPASKDSSFYPGYYKPEHRATRIKQLLAPEDSWNTEKMKSVITDVRSPVDSAVATGLYSILMPARNWSSDQEAALEKLLWNGEHNLENPSPTIYYRLLYHTLHDALGDELGEDDFQLFLKTHLIKKIYPRLIENSSSVWWDNVATAKIETREQILIAAFEKTFDGLTEQFDKNPEKWHWQKIHTLEIKHPLGKIDILRPIFNIGPHPVAGGYETINQADFLLDNDGQFQVKGGPQMRIILDFAAIENSVSISPSGQSGHVYSKHYDDQSKMYRDGKFRAQSMSLHTGSKYFMKFVPVN